jgi:hypothetical protein
MAKQTNSKPQKLNEGRTIVKPKPTPKPKPKK